MMVALEALVDGGDAGFYYYGLFTEWPNGWSAGIDVQFYVG